MFTTISVETGIYHNIITEKGKRFFLERLINNNESISMLQVGNGTSTPTKEDTDITNPTTFNNLDKKIVDNKLYITTTTQGSRILNSTEIGVKTDLQNLISRNTHTPIIVPSTAEVTIEYIYTFTDGEYKTGWVKTDGYEKVYQTNNNYRISSVIGGNDRGCKKVNSIDEVESTELSYYNDTVNNILYIHTHGNTDPNTLNITIIYESGDYSL